MQILGPKPRNVLEPWIQGFCTIDAQPPAILAVKDVVANTGVGDSVRACCKFLSHQDRSVSFVNFHPQTVSVSCVAKYKTMSSDVAMWSAIVVVHLKNGLGIGSRWFTAKSSRVSGSST